MNGDPRPTLPLTVPVYRSLSARSQAWLSRAAQVGAGFKGDELRPERPVTDELLSHLTEADIEKLWGTD